MINWREPTVAKGVAVVILLAWTAAGWILDKPVGLKVLLAAVFVCVWYILIVGIRIAVEQLADYAGRLEDEREE